MDNAFQLLDPEEGQVFLRQFESEARRQGESLFRSGSVQNLIADQPGVAYSAQVGPGPVQKVVLEYDRDQGWEATCTCSQKFNCAHIFAAMRSLLAEHNTAIVRSLSANIVPAFFNLPGAKPRRGATEDGELARRLSTALGRRLKPPETKFLNKLHAVYTRSCQTQHITRWDFQEIGLGLGGYGWEGLDIWPKFPADEHEFWLYVAHTAQQRGVSIPDFMQPVTDLAGIKDQITQWLRSKEVAKWKQTLGALHVNLQGPVLADQGETDLRLLIDEKEAHLLWQRPGREGFEPVRAGQMQHLAEAAELGRLQFTAEGKLLWELFSQRLYLGTTQLRYHEPDAVRVLGHLLRTRLLESRVLTLADTPLARPAEPLRWQLQPASSLQDDYGLRLVQADGTPPPPVLCTISGRPALYLTLNALFIGPAPQSDVLSITRETRIPAPAIESAAGLTFLQGLGVELPPRIRERVRTLGFEVIIQCHLRPVYYGSRTEECAVKVAAAAPDGHQETWNGQSWTVGHANKSPKGNRHEQGIVLYDRSALAPVPALLEPLNLRFTNYEEGLALRITRKFPELFAAWLKTIPPHISVHLDGDLASFATPDVAGTVKLDATEAGIDWFDLRVVLDVNDATLTPAEIKLLLNAKGKYVRLEGKGWRRLQFNLSDEENERLARLGLSTRELSAEPQRLHALQLADDAAKKFLPEQQVEQIQRRAGELKTRVAPDLPGGVTAQLRPYQLEGFHFLAYLASNHFGGILADDMGLGKTLQTLAWLLWLREASPTSDKSSQPSSPEAPALVVCPKSVMDNWHAEAARFTPGLRVKIWPPSELQTFRDRLSEADLHVLNYTQLRSLGESLASVQWRAVILDEGQYIKNPSSQTAQVARVLRADHRLVLSGTPIENRLMDLWSLMAFAMPGVLGSRAHFGRLYDAKGDPFARRRLSSRVRPFLLRRTKSQVAKDLPDRIEEDLFCEIEGDQQILYRAELKRAQQLLLRVKTQKELAAHQLHFLTSLLRLRQICCHPQLVNPDLRVPGAKTEALLEQLEPLMEEGNKVLVFSQFVELLGLLRPLLEERNWPLFYLAGDTENRGELVRQFQATEGPAIFLISLKAGGFGINLTAASYVVLFDPWWNPAVEMQAIDRTHRIGQVNKVIAYRLLIKNSIEEKIRALQKQKKALAEDVLGEERFSQSLTLDDLHFLFAD